MTIKNNEETLERMERMVRATEKDERQVESALIVLKRLLDKKEGDVFLDLLYTYRPKGLEIDRR
jgi:hypothetical protein